MFTLHFVREKWNHAQDRLFGATHSSEKLFDANVISAEEYLDMHITNTQ